MEIGTLGDAIIGNQLIEQFFDVWLVELFAEFIECSSGEDFSLVDHGDLITESLDLSHDMR